MKLHQHLRTLSVLSFLILVLTNGSIAIAQDRETPSSALLEEIIVTAQKREQRLSDIGVSVAAFTGEQMRNLGVTSTLDLGRTVPGLDVTGYGGGAITVFSIRGASQLSFDDQHEQPVAVYLDGAYVSFLSGVGFNFYDLDRVEVLRGSQGALFGRNATGGVVHILSQRPTDIFEGYAEVTLGDYDERKIEGALNVPFTDTIKGRLSVFREKNDGYVKNLTRHGEDHYDKDNISARAQLLFEPSDDLSIHLVGRASIDDANAEAFYTRPNAINAEGLTIVAPDAAAHFDYCTGPFGRTTATPVLGATDCYGYFRARPDDPFVVENDYDTEMKRDMYGTTATVNYSVGPATITSITDWQDLKKRYKGDSDTSPSSLFHFFQDFDGTQISEELRLAIDTERTRWTTGLYYLNIDTNGRAGVDGVPVLGLSLDNLFELETTTYAVFGHVEHNLTESLSVSLGGRWTEDKKTYEFNPRCTSQPGLQGLSAETCFAVFGTGFVQGTGLPKTTKREGDWSGDIGLNWHARDGQLVYGKITRGHKGGGFSGGILGFFPLSEATYEGEFPLTYEVGFKSDMFDGRARTNVSVFYTDYKDFQTFYLRPGPTHTVFNVDAEVLGSEIEIVANPWEGWDFMLGLALMDGEQKDLTFEGITRARPMPTTPDVSFNALGRREWPAFGGRLALQVDAAYKGERTMSAIDHPANTAESYTLWNASAEWASADDRVAIKLWGTNLGDETYFPRIFGCTTGCIQYIVGEPRWYHMSVRVRW